MTLNRPKSATNILNKRTPRNPKYENIQPTIDTGESLTKFLRRHEELHASSKQKAGEIFKRIQISTLVQLIIQVAEINSLQNDQDKNASQKTLIDTNRPQTQDSQINSISTSRSTLQSVIRGVGEMDMCNYSNNCYLTLPITLKIENKQQINIEYEERPYLIVDLRDKDDFKTNHIVSAHHYPAAMLSRCTNNESKELLIYKNQKGKIIILYDDDERIVQRAATIMVERDYNNIFVLSGGLKYAARKFPRGLITGVYPLSWTLSSVPSTSIRKITRTQSMNIPQTEKLIGQSISLLTQSTPEPSITFDDREQFTRDDIEQLNIQLNTNLLSKGNGTRLSRLKTQTSKQNSKISNLNNISDQPWKP